MEKVFINNAKWITASFYPDMSTGRSNTVNNSGYLRYNFSIKKEIKSAFLTICALGLGVTYINGKRVTDDVLTTPFTAYDKRVIFSKYDVKNLLNCGENAILVHLGNGFYNCSMREWKDEMAPWRDAPKVILSLEIIYKDNTKEYIDSGEHFKSKEGPCIYNQMREGEIYDARLCEKGCDNIGFDDSEWMGTKIINPPGGIYEYSDMPSVRVKEVIKPVKVFNNIYDFGINMSGRVRIKLKGEKGQKVKIAYGEELTEDKMHLACEDTERLRGSNAFCHIFKTPVAQETIYYANGEGEEEYAPEFTYYGFQYVKVENAPKDFEIVAEFIQTDFERTGTFKSSSEMLNAIHDMSVRATISNYVGMPTDCPHREQLGWTGDALNSVHQFLFTYDGFDSYYKWLNDFKDAQRPSGQLPGIVPSASWGFNWGCGPTFDSALVMLPYFSYIYTGKTDIIENMWDNMELYMKYTENHSRNGIYDFGLPDWCPPKGIKLCKRAVTDTAYIYTDFVTMAKMAKLIGKKGKVYEEKAKYIKEAFRNNFLNDEENLNNQTFLAVSIYHKLVNEDEAKDFAKRLAKLIEENDYHFECGTVGIKSIYDVLSEAGYIEHLYKATVNKTYPSYGYYVECGLTTLPESWDMANSRNHHMYSEVNNWLYRHVGGIKHTEDGVVIAPLMLKDVDEVSVTFKDIKVERNKDKLTFTVPSKTRVIFNGVDKYYKKGTYTI